MIDRFGIGRYGRLSVFLGLAITCILPAARGETDCVSSTAGCCCVGRVGNVDCDYKDLVDISDLTLLIDYLYMSHAPLLNRAEANIDGSPDGVVDVGDLTRLIDFLFISYTELPGCPEPFNTPPRTEIRSPAGWDYLTYINASEPGNPATGIPAEWMGSDPVDHPYSQPDFDYEWRLYGPYPANFSLEQTGSYDPARDTTYEELMDRFVRRVFRRLNGEIFFVGDNETFLVCDTIPVPVEIDPTGFQIVCDTVLIDTIQVSGPLGMLDTILTVDDYEFKSDERFNRIALNSYDGTDEWVADTLDELYDVFQAALSDTTEMMRFIFWVRSRDPVDPGLYDPTPALVPVIVIDPKFEHDIYIADLQIAYSVNGRILDSARAFWARAIDNWAVATGTTVNYDSAGDYYVPTATNGDRFTLQRMLSGKMLLILNDNSFPGGLADLTIRQDLFTALDLGVNVWLCGRAQWYGCDGGEPNFDVFPTLRSEFADALGYYFGIENSVYSGWEWHIFVNSQRIEDFAGALTLDAGSWPDLPIDTALLHRRYAWKDHYPWIDTLAVLPEVDWFVRKPGSVPMYLYNSLFGAEHWLNDPNYNFHGRPVAMRYATSAFRTAVWMFTPYAFEESAAQLAVNDMLSWLYDPYLTEPVRELRYPGAPVLIDTAAVRHRYRQGLPRSAEPSPAGVGE
ncbi:MAG: hypothetical protein JSU65_12130 [Candidatus Zixiibacteriota bacterium]|nr:MAG: hypothetical protein JSU65_12130 [candidate division Zixibacteria bacterium]